MANHKQVIENFFASERNEKHFTRSANTFFEGDTLYSYGKHFPMAKFVRNTAGQTAILITSDTYSVTTARHLSLVRQAANETSLPVLFVESLKAADMFAGGFERVMSEAVTMHRANIDALIAKRDRARSQWRREDYQARIWFAEWQVRAIARFLEGNSIGTNPVFPRFNTNRQVA